MSEVPLGSLFRFIRNGMNVKQDKSGVGLPITRIETISDAVVDQTRVGFAGLRDEDARDWLLEPGDILFSHINSVQHIGKCAVYRGQPEKLVHGMNLLCLRSDKTKLNPEFAKYLLRSGQFRARLSNCIKKAVNQASVSIGDIQAIPVTLPPLPEQRRIAEILDKADALRAKRRAALAQLDTLTQSIFLDMFGNPATNPRGWPWYRLGDVSDFFAGSTLPEGEAFTGQIDGYFLLKVSDMNLPGNEVYLKTCQQWSEVPGAASCTCPEGSVVIPKRGGAIGTNKKRITTRPSVLDPNLMAIAPRPGQTELQFLYAWLLHLDLASITSGSSVPQLNKRDLDPLSIAVPPFDLQQEFARRVGEVQKVVDSQHAAESHLEHLFSALQHRAFRGEL